MTLSCGVLLEPISRRQKLLQESVEMYLKGVLQAWDASALTQTPTETWVLQASRSSEQEAAVFQQLLQKLSVFSLHVVRHPNTAVQFDSGQGFMCIFWKGFPVWPHFLNILTKLYMMKSVTNYQCPRKVVADVLKNAFYMVFSTI